MRSARVCETYSYKNATIRWAPHSCVPTSWVGGPWTEVWLPPRLQGARAACHSHLGRGQRRVSASGNCDAPGGERLAGLLGRAPPPRHSDPRPSPLRRLQAKSRRALHSHKARAPVPSPQDIRAPLPASSRHSQGGKERVRAPLDRGARATEAGSSSSRRFHHAARHLRRAQHVSGVSRTPHQLLGKVRGSGGCWGRRRARFGSVPPGKGRLPDSVGQHLCKMNGWGFS